MRALRSPVKAEMCAASEGLSNDLSLRVPQCSTDRQGFAILCSLCAVSCSSPRPSRKNDSGGFKFYFVRNILLKAEKTA